MLVPGDQAPDFVATAHDGRRIALSDFRGRKVLLWFFPQAHTPGCTMEARGFRDLYPDFQRLNVAILGASFDTREENTAFAIRLSLPFPLLCDTDKRLALAYGAVDDTTAITPRRVSCLIDGDGRVMRYYPQVSARDHPAEVLRDLLG
jgi:peroxiredoxin Q/BCP